MYTNLNLPKRIKIAIIDIGNTMTTATYGKDRQTGNDVRKNTYILPVY